MLKYCSFFRPLSIQHNETGFTPQIILCCVELDPKDVIISDLRTQLEEKEEIILDLRERLARCHCKPASTGYSTPFENLSNKQLNRIVLPIVKVIISTFSNCGIVQIWVAIELYQTNSDRYLKDSFN